MKILVVCGAGASSTFVAQRLNSALRAEGLGHQAHAGNGSSLLYELDTADVVLLGPHMADTADDIRGLTGERGPLITVLPDDIYSDLDGTRALSVLREVLAVPAGKSSPAAENTEEGNSMSASRTVTVASSSGLHARPAKLFVEAVQGTGSTITLAKGEKSVNAASILTVLSLGVEKGDEVTLTAEGGEEEQALDTLEHFLTTDHDA